MDLIEINVDTRTTWGKGAARSLRREGKVPAILYGPKIKPIMLSVNKADIETTMKKRGGSQLPLRLRSSDQNVDGCSVMLRDKQKDVITEEFIHADFYAFPEDKKVRVNVRVHTTGESKGVELGGVLQIIRHELEVLCRPFDIPDAIVLDVTDLDIGDSIHVDDIPLKDNVEIPREVNFTVLTVVTPKRESVETTEEEEEDETVEDESQQSSSDGDIKKQEK